MTSIISNQDKPTQQVITLRTREMLSLGDRGILRADYTTPYFGNFIIQGNKITFDQPFNTYYSQLLIDQILPNQAVYSFQVKIEKSKNNGIFVGITNRKRHKNERVSHIFPQVFTFFGKKALVWPGRIQQTRGFTQGDTIVVRVDRIQDKIEWYVNGYLYATKRNAKIGKKQYQYVPFVQMLDKNDTIVWEGSWTD